MLFPNLQTMIGYARTLLLSNSKLVHTERWQGMNIGRKPEMATHECLFVELSAPMGTEDLQELRDAIRPNIPWADNHFLERVCGQPLNPGVEWANWPYATSADRFRDKDGWQQFNHNYMERYWPKYAHRTRDGILPWVDPKNNDDGERFRPREGIRHPYGDLENVVRLLAKEPDTRQAYMPVWFPEDTGDIHDGRKPCTLGYHFIMRGEQLHVTYDIRSCDYIRHFRDDVYLTIRLVLWILDRLREGVDIGDYVTAGGERWKSVTPGRFVMHIASLHVFRNDFDLLKSEQP